MPRVTIHLPNDLNDKLTQLAEKNDASLSSTITKMAELGLMISENKNNNKSMEDRFLEIERHCFKLVIQTNALLKKMATNQLGYGSDEFKKLTEASVNKYRELLGLEVEEL